MLISLCANEQGLSIRNSKILWKWLWLESRVSSHWLWLESSHFVKNVTLVESPYLSTRVESMTRVMLSLVLPVPV